MKIQLYIYKCEYTKEFSVFSFETKHHGPMVKEVTLDIPSDTLPSDEEYKRLVYLHNLSNAEREVQIKRDELTKAEELVRNMMAIEHKPS